MSEELVVFQHAGLRLTQADHEVILKSIVGDNATAEEVRVYYYDCARRGVHPMDRLIHFSKRSGRYVPLVGIDYMRQRAESSGAYAGSDDASIVGDDTAKYPYSASVTVWKRFPDGQRFPFTATARWSEYAPHPIEDKSGFMWRKMPHTMLAKCAEALALRKAFPGELAGLYVREELDQADGTERTITVPASVDVLDAVPEAKRIGPPADPDPEPRDWPEKTVSMAEKVWKEAGVLPADTHTKHVVMLLNLSPFGVVVSEQDIHEWGLLYRGLREGGMTTKQAASAARAQYFEGAPTVSEPSY